jgi:ArsR family transcriptional regulator, arsenate/arsenite/antimonite-responsive transcriptional repressor
LERIAVWPADPPAAWQRQTIGLLLAHKLQMTKDRLVDYADMFAALGSEPRLRIVRLLLAAYPEGLIVGDIQAELGIANSTLSHHLEKLKHEGLVGVRRDSNRLWYCAKEDVLEELLAFLFAECCTRSGVVDPKAVLPKMISEPCAPAEKKAKAV